MFRVFRVLGVQSGGVFRVIRVLDVQDAEWSGCWVFRVFRVLGI